MPSGMKRVFITPLTAVETTDKEDVGTLRFEGNKIYKWVALANVTATVAVAAGDAVAYLAATGHNTNTVVSDNSDADATIPVCAGIVGAVIAGVAGTTYYCWIQIAGPVTVLKAIAGTPADGDQLCISATDKTLRVQEFAGTDPNIQAVGAYCGVATDQSAKLVALACPF